MSFQIRKRPNSWGVSNQQADTSVLLIQKTYNMRKLSAISYLLFMSLLFSCSDNFEALNNDELNIDRFPQKWTLVKMSGQTPYSEETGNDMKWQEYYMLHEDQTFVKFREEMRSTATGTGVYSYQNLSDGMYLILTYEVENAIIGSCTADLKERSFMNSNSTLKSTWQACDGPGLEYKLVAAGCYSPLQNLDIAHEEGAVGCNCDHQVDEDICVQDSFGHNIGLICREGKWAAVNDGPCMLELGG